MNNIEQPLFSVLVANYNNGKHLEECLQSVFSQTYNNWEIIIVDDASRDNSHEVYHKYRRQGRISIYLNKINKGCGYSKQKCIELAKGELLGFLDADDVLLPSALETMVNHHVNKLDVSLLLSRFYYCDKDMNKTGESRLLIIPDGLSYLTHADFRPEHFMSFKNGYIKKTHGISKHLPLAVDQDLIFKLEEVGKLDILNEFTYKYRVHELNNSYVNEKKAIYWNIIVRHEASIRRGINPENVSYKSFLNTIDHYYNMGRTDSLLVPYIFKYIIFQIKKFLKPFIRRKRI